MDLWVELISSVLLSGERCKVLRNVATVIVSPANKLPGISLKWPSGFFNLLIKSFQDNISEGSKGHTMNIAVHALGTVLAPAQHKKPYTQMDVCKIPPYTEGID